MAKGAEEKQIILKRILETFNGAFVYNNGKEIRIPINDVQIKVALTCAKDNVDPGDENRLPGEIKTAGMPAEDPNTPLPWNEVPEEKPEVKASAEEIELVNKLMKDLNL